MNPAVRKHSTFSVPALTPSARTSQTTTHTWHRTLCRVRQPEISIQSTFTIFQINSILTPQPMPEGVTEGVITDAYFLLVKFGTALIRTAAVGASS